MNMCAELAGVQVTARVLPGESHWGMCQNQSCGECSIEVVKSMLDIRRPRETNGFMKEGSQGACVLEKLAMSFL